MTTEHTPADDEGPCGWSYDHDLRLVSEGNGGRTYECRECGAEINEDDEEPA